MGENISWGPTRFYIRSTTFQYFDDNSTMYTSDKRVSTVLDSQSYEFTILSNWFYNNFTVLNPDECSFMLLGIDHSLQTNLVCSDEILKTQNRKKH